MPVICHTTLFVSDIAIVTKIDRNLSQSLSRPNQVTYEQHL